MRGRMKQSMSGLSENIWLGRAFACGIAILPLACSIAFAVVYGTMASAMTEFDENAVLAAETISTSTMPAEYDLCGGQDIVQPNGFQNSGTGWGTILEFNMILYSVISGCIGMMVLGTFFCPFWCCGSIFASCGASCGQIAAIIVTGIFRLSKDGKACAKVGTDGEESIFTEHGATIMATWIAQMVCCCPMFFSIQVASEIAKQTVVMTVTKYFGNRM